MALATRPNIVALSSRAVSALLLRSTSTHARPSLFTTPASLPRPTAACFPMLDPSHARLHRYCSRRHIYQHLYYSRASPVHPKPVPRNLPRRRAQSANISDHDLAPPTRRSRSQQTDPGPDAGPDREAPAALAPLPFVTRNQVRPFSREGAPPLPPHALAPSLKWSMPRRPPPPPTEPLRQTPPQ